MKKTVEVTATIVKSRKKTKPKIFVVDAMSDSKALEKAKLEWANEYINKDCKVHVFDRLSNAEKFISGIKITAKIIN